MIWQLWHLFCIRVTVFKLISNPISLYIYDSLKTLLVLINYVERFYLFLPAGILLAQETQALSGPKLVDFKSVLAKNETIVEKVESLKNEVQAFADKFFIPAYGS